MSKRRKTNRTSTPPEPEVENANSVDRFEWSAGVRGLVSLILILYLGVVLLGPLANPIGGDFFARPLARMVAPIHQALYLGHGYRFFGPDPGPSHLIFYQIELPDGKQTEGRFPDREKLKPRLLYHRWFMLSESIYNEHAFTPDESTFVSSQKEQEARISDLRAKAHFSVADRLQVQYDIQKSNYDRTRRRIDLMVQAVARRLVQIESNDAPAEGTRIELYVQERIIPTPTDVQLGKKLGDPEYLMLPASIGTFEVKDGQLIRIADPTAPAESLQLNGIGAGEGGL